MLRHLKNLAGRYPLATNVLTVGTTTMTGNVVSQKLIQRNEHFHWSDLGRYGVLGFCFTGPVLALWFRSLTRWTERLAVSASRKALAKMAVDQFLFAPVFVPFFFVCSKSLEGQPPSEYIPWIKNNIGPTMKTNYALWPAAQLFNFYAVPIRHQVLFSSCVALVWNSYLATVDMEKEDSTTNFITGVT